MNTQSKTLALYDSQGECFGALHMVPKADDLTKGECIFDVAPRSEEQGERHEVRWLCKRHFQRWSEHRFKLGEDGSVTVHLNKFRIVFEPNSDGVFTLRPPAPPVTAIFDVV